jgi:hypothetical protein
MKKREATKIPEFQSLEEEREYWESRGPLAEERKGRIDKPKPRQKRSSFLAVRLTGEELMRLRDIAAKRGIGPSTFARLVLMSVIEDQSKLSKHITLDKLKDALEANLPPLLQEKAEAIAKAISIGDPPYLLEINKVTREELQEFFLQFISSFLAIAGVEVGTSENAKTEGTKPLAGKI